MCFDEKESSINAFKRSKRDERELVGISKRSDPDGTHPYHGTMEPDEAFPNAKHIFKQAFSAQNPAPLLLQIIKDHPTYPALYDLVFYYTQAVENDPYRAKSLASALARVSNSPDAPSIGDDTIRVVLIYELARHHFKILYNTSSNAGRVYGPKNHHLIHSLLSGFSFKYNLTSSPDMRRSMEDGWNAPLSLKESELLVVGTCIQLLIHGYTTTTKSAGTYQRQPEMVAKKLKAHRMAGTVKDPHAIEVLEVHYFFLIFKETH